MNDKLEQRERRIAPGVVVADELRRGIYSAVYRDREWLPTERELAASLGVHRDSVREAIDALSKEGLLIVKPRCRPVVHNPKSVRGASDTVARPTTRLVALVMWKFQNSDGATPQEQIFFGMSEVLAEAGYHGVFLNLGNRFGSSEDMAVREAEYLTQSLTKGFDGVVFYPNAYDQNLVLMREVAHRMPLVFIDRMPTGVEADYVGVDNTDAIYRLTNHLIDQGHERIAYVSGDEPINTVGDRLKGFRQAMGERFDTPRSAVVCGTGIGTPWSAFELLFQGPVNTRPTALICVNDVEARNAAWRLQEFGLSIPGDVSLTGFDNIVKLLPNGEELTTVEQPFRKIGETAAQLILRRLDDPTAPISQMECKTQILLRSSVAAPGFAVE